jgi:hypothetical protein
MEVTAEGNPLRLAERRTLSHPNRKIVLGSTPLSEDGRTAHRPSPSVVTFVLSWCCAIRTRFSIACATMRSRFCTFATLRDGSGRATKAGRVRKAE